MIELVFYDVQVQCATDYNFSILYLNPHVSFMVTVQRETSPAHTRCTDTNNNSVCYRCNTFQNYVVIIREIIELTDINYMSSPLIPVLNHV